MAGIDESGEDAFRWSVPSGAAAAVAEGEAAATAVETAPADEAPFWSFVQGAVPIIPMRAVVRVNGAELGPVLGETRQNAYAAVSFQFQDDVFSVVLEAITAVNVESCTVELRHAFPSDEQVLLNGYQSWTDTVERSPWERMRGLKGVPRFISDRFVLDGGGDYRFTEYVN